MSAARFVGDPFSSLDQTKKTPARPRARARLTLGARSHQPGLAHARTREKRTDGGRRERKTRDERDERTDRPNGGRKEKGFSLLLGRPLAWLRSLARSRRAQTDSLVMDLFITDACRRRRDGASLARSRGEKGEMPPPPHSSRHVTSRLVFLPHRRSPDLVSCPSLQLQSVLPPRRLSSLGAPRRTPSHPPAVHWLRGCVRPDREAAARRRSEVSDSLSLSPTRSPPGLVGSLLLLSSLRSLRELQLRTSKTDDPRN